MHSEALGSDGFFKAVAWLQANQKQVLLGTATAIVVGLIIYFVIWQRNEKQVAAGEAFSKALSAQMNSRSESPDPFLKVASAYPGSKAAEQALLFAAASLYADGKYSDAQARFETFTREHPGSPLTAQALLGIAASLEAQGKTDLALNAYKSLVERYPGENVVPQAKFALGRIYEAQDKPELARTMYGDLARESLGSLGQEAGMRLEELKLKYPNLAPAVQPSTNASAFHLPTK
jgi:TolA-binding protein